MKNFRKAESLETVHTSRVYKLIKNEGIKNTSERIELKGLKLKYNNSA